MKNKLSTIIIFIVLFCTGGCYFQHYNTSDPTDESHFLSVSNGAHHHSVADGYNKKFFSATLTIEGDVRYPMTLTVDSLKKMRTVGLDSFNVVCQSGATTSRSVRSRGVLLKDILEKAVIIQTDHRDRNFYIVARASDGYKATFSWAEIFNNPTGENTYVIFEENGRPIDNKGAMILNCTNDTRTGTRHVTWLKSIEVNKVE